MSESVTEVKQTESPIILIVDDQYAEDMQRQQSMVKNIPIPGLITKFVGSCEEALEAFRKETNIVLCFLDCMLPEFKDTTSSYNPDQDSDIRGIKIVDAIVKINEKILIAIYSSHVNEPELRKEANQNKNIIDYFKKEKSVEDFYIFISNSLEKLGLDLNKLNQTQKKKIEKQSYDYGQLEPETRLLIQERTEQIKKLVKRSTQDIVDIGRYLTDVKRSLKHGEFYPWLQSEFQWSWRTAVRFMKVYDKFKFANLSDLKISPSVLYELSTNSVSDAAIEKTIEIAASGETVTIELAKSIKEKYQKKKKGEDGISNSSLKSTVDFPLAPAKDNISNVEKTSIKDNIVKVISPQRIWHLGKQQQHIVMCQDVNSTKFIEKLPPNIALCLAFPPTKNWQFKYDLYKSMMTFFSEYNDLDDAPLLKSIQQTIEITTNDSDLIVVCFVPHLSILSLIDVLGCRAIVAEPNRDKCLALVEASQRIN